MSAVTEDQSRCPEEAKSGVPGNRKAVLMPGRVKIWCPWSPKTNLDARQRKNPVSMVTEERSRCPEEHKGVRGNRRPISMPDRGEIRCPR
ncbi:hypothetical protein ABE288_21290 [Bacillus salipaludis]|uniref:hypothetical protein n=1 Tax=Bacillus salipaludis TaxID=2547811 RepID=UPI003D1D91C8